MDGDLSSIRSPNQTNVMPFPVICCRIRFCPKEKQLCKYCIFDRAVFHKSYQIYLQSSYLHSWLCRTILWRIIYDIAQRGVIITCWLKGMQGFSLNVDYHAYLVSKSFLSGESLTAGLFGHCACSDRFLNFKQGSLGRPWLAPCGSGC